MNIKLKGGTLMIDHLNVFQGMVNHLPPMKIVMDDEMQASLLLCSLLVDSWENFIMIIDNSI